MTLRAKTDESFRFRLQGTDGIRAETRVASSTDFKGLTPQRVFLDRGFITEEFLELYAFAHVKGLIRRKQIKREASFVVGWDPRDTTGRFTGAVVRGVRKAGADVLVIGVVPTPLVPLFVLYKNADGGFMVTASHNPRDQNGLKTFSAFRGMKLLPQDDVELTRAVLALDYETVRRRPLTGKRTRCRDQAMKVFARFSLDPENSWANSGQDNISWRDIILVVDPANGSLSKTAADIFRQAGFPKVLEVNSSLKGNVNLYSGVADLEGHSVIQRAMIEKHTGAFHKHKAVVKLFQLGKKYRPRVQEGSLRVCAAVFDADGDRFYHLEYDPFQDALLVLSGDETACLQARFLMQRNPSRYRRGLYINTVESDLNTGSAARALGLTPKLTAVGDKWILLRIATKIAESRIQLLQRTTKSPLPPKIANEWTALKKQGILSVRRFQEFEEALDRLQKKSLPMPADQDLANRLPFAVGSEETGHNITQGLLQCEDGRKVPVFFGNGLKSALNTLAAAAHDWRGKSVKRRFNRLHHPFPAGFKQTLYAYYIRKQLFCRNSTVWRRVRRTILEDAKNHGYLAGGVRFSEDPDMLYIGLKQDAGTFRSATSGSATSGSATSGSAGVFVRNSGTENKISVNLRGDRKDRRALRQIGEKVIRLLLSTLKDNKNHFYKLELDVLSQVAAEPVDRLILDKGAGTRLLIEMQKQDLIRLSPKGYCLTRRGKWYITSG